MVDLDLTNGQGATIPSRGEVGGIGSVSVNAILENGKEVNINPDGTVDIFDPQSPAVHSGKDDDDSFSDNLAERLPESALMSLATEVIEGVEDDERSRASLLTQYEKGLDLLGTTIEEVSTPSSPSRSISRVGHPLLMETMIKYHAGSEAEMLPAEGPAKVMTVGQVTSDEEQLAADFQSDLNYFLTDIAAEFYPDTSKMIMELAFAGNVYKKVYRDPMRDRPVSESVSMLDLIVSEQATDLTNAIRVTHQIEMTRSQLRRMQISGAYRDVDLGYSQQFPMPAHQALKRHEGLSPATMRPQDIPYFLWETDQDVDLSMHPITGKFERRAPDGLPLPYKITVDKNTRQVLGVWRNWKQGDKLYKKRNMYVHYGLVPATGLRFHHWGFLQILGNHTKVQRAIWRLLVDAGMFSVFPGGVKLRGGRTATNEIQPGPGEWIDIDAPAGTADIRNILMALPYKEISAVYVQFAQMIDSAAKELAGTVTIETGEGRTNIPVGTMMSMIEQQTQIMAGVHKRTHRAQREELFKLRELFAENPEDLWRLARDPARRWQVGEEFMDLNLVPASDPNIPSQVHRIQLAVALATLAQMAPTMFDQREVLTRLMRTIRIPNPQALLITPEQQQAASQGAAAGPPVDPSKMAAVQLRQQIAGQQMQQKQQESAAQSQEADKDRQAHAQSAILESQDREKDRESKTQIEQMKEQTEQARLASEIRRDEINAQRQAQQDARQDQQQREQAAREEQVRQEEAAREEQHRGEDRAQAEEQQRRQEEQKAATTPFGPGTF